MAESVKVIVRCRPMNQRELDLKSKNVIVMDTKIAQCSIRNPSEEKAPPKTFTFDGAYGVDSTTEQIYGDIGYPLVEGVCEGYNGTIFAYGQTGCGKSFSMQGIVDPATQRGIIPRAFDHIFETIQVTENTKYLVHASYLEIYNEEIRDLLGKDIKKKLELKEHPDKGVYTQGLSMHPCKSVQDCERIMSKGWSNRSTGSTLMNADSSRSHSIFTIFLERSDADDEGEEHIRAAKLNLVDLAGSERQAKTGATGDRLKEATKINLSLSALGNVISALVDGKSKHIPYRDSKLTRLLQDSLGGNTKTLMVACLSPSDNNYDESLSTLRYANRAKNIKNKPKINEDPKDALLREYQEEINRLKAMLRGEIPIELGTDDRAGIVPQPPKRQDDKEIEAEKQRLKEEYEAKIQDMKHEFEEMKISKVKLEEEMLRIKENYEQEVASVEHGGAVIPSPGQQTEAMGQTGQKAAKVAKKKAAAIPSEETPADSDGEPEPSAPETEDSQYVTDPATQVNRTETVQHASQVVLKSEMDKQWEGVPVIDPTLTAQLYSGEMVAVRNTQGDVQVIPVAQSTYLEPGDEILHPTETTVEVPVSEDQMLGSSGDASEEQPQSHSQEDTSYAQQVLEIASQLTQVKTVGEEGSLEVTHIHPKAPAASPTAQDHSATNVFQGLSHEEALKRLEELQQQMVGGEQAHNEEVKERRQKKKKHVEERKRRLQEALSQMEGDEIMLQIYDNIGDELRMKDKLLQKEKDKNDRLNAEIKDLQAEFEFERVDYLEDLRRQDKHIKWMEAVIDKIHPCLRRDCNYINLDRIKTQSTWNDDESGWTLPKMTVEKTKLPPAMANNYDAMPYGKGGYEDDDRNEEKLLHKLNQSDNMSNTYFKPTRQEKLLREKEKHDREIAASNQRNRHLPNAQPAPWVEPLSRNDLRAAEIHGQLSNGDLPLRKPARLEALHPPSTAGRKKRPKPPKTNGLDY